MKPVLSRHSLGNGYRAFLIWIFFLAPLHAQNLDQVMPAPVPQLVEPAEPETAPASPESLAAEILDDEEVLIWAAPGEEVILPKLKGVRVVGTPAAVDPSALSESEPLVSEVGSSELRENILLLLSLYLDEPASMESIERMVQALRLLLAQSGYPFSIVYVPQQDITDGFLHLVVVESRLGQISVQGSTHFSDTSYISRIPLSPGQRLDTRALGTGLDRINSNPFRDATARFAQGAEPGTADLILTTRDRLPVRLFAGYNNTGSKSTSEDRVLAGIDWGNVFGTAYLASVQWTSDPAAEHSRAISGNLISDLPGGNTLTTFGAYSEIEGKTGPEFDQQGGSWQAGINLDLPRPSSNPSLSRRWILGLDFKSSDNNLDFLQPPFVVPIIDNVTHIVQARAAYRVSRTDPWGSTAYGTKLTFSPGGLTSRNNDSSFEGSRAGAEATYVYGTLDGFRLTRLPRGWTWTVRAEGQLASTNLLGSEGLSGGGLHSVRGYHEGEAIGDNGIVLRQELRAPPLRPAASVFSAQTPDSLTLYAFQDAAYLRNTDPLEGERASELASIGLGLEYQFGSNLTLLLAYGHQLTESGSGSGDSGRLHASFTLSF